MQPHLTWPDGNRFAFTVFDDTDFTTLQNGPPVYQLLSNLGFRTTKSIWPLKGDRVPEVGGTTCEDPDYLAWVRRLQDQGFEIALHNVTYHTSAREQIITGIRQFEEFFGFQPELHVNHRGCHDSIYWGDARLSGPRKLCYNLLTRFRNRHKFLGHVEGSELFWGDICKQTIKYVRNFVYRDINTLKACPYMPYSDEQRPYVNYWFASSEGPNVRSFNETISEENQDRLEEEGGACIMYTHFGSGFFRDGKLNPRFRQLMERLSKKPGWFVPVSTLLNHILSQRGHHSITRAERRELEWSWIRGKVAIGGSS